MTVTSGEGNGRNEWEVPEGLPGCRPNQVCFCGVPKYLNLSGLDLGNAYNPGLASDSSRQSNLEPDILECEVRQALGSVTMNKASGGDGSPGELLQIMISQSHSIIVCQFHFTSY